MSRITIGLGCALLAGAAAAEPLQFRSAFDGYQSFTDEKVRPWKESNDTVGRIGGWRAYAREAQGQPQPVERATRPRAPASHSGHGKP